MGAKTAVKVPEASMNSATVTKVGYVAIIKGVDYGERELDIDDPTLYEDAKDCEIENKDAKGFLAVARVEWQEAA